MSYVHLLWNVLDSHQLHYLQGLGNQDFPEKGRQGTGYERMPLIVPGTEKIRKLCLELMGFPSDEAHDCYLLRYPVNSYIGPHKDDAPYQREHHRLNIIVRNPERGGELFISGKKYEFEAGDAYYFRPDLEEHEVTKIESGTRLVFTVGALL